jgi:hypothetical protein
MRYLFALLLSATICFGGWERGITKREPNGAASVVLNDQTTEPVDSYFLRSINTFTLAADTVESGEEAGTLVYTFEASAGHALVATDQVLLLDTAADRDFFCQVVSVATNTITIDRPIDHVFPAATTLAREVSNDMAVDGSTTPVIFTARAGVTPTDVTRVLLYIESSGATASNKYGDLTKLTRGTVFRIYNGVHKTVFNFKSNGEIKSFCYDTDPLGAIGTGNPSISARITFAGSDKHGVALRLSDDDRLQFIVQDDLTGLLIHNAILEGHKTEGEQ